MRQKAKEKLLELKNLKEKFNENFGIVDVAFTIAKEKFELLESSEDFENFIKNIEKTILNLSKKRPNREEIESGKGIYQYRKRGQIRDALRKEVHKENYGKHVGDIGIVELYENKFFITCETSRGSEVLRKYIPKEILPLFKDIIPLATANGKYRDYRTEKHVMNIPKGLYVVYPK